MFWATETAQRPKHRIAMLMIEKGILGVGHLDSPADGQASNPDDLDIVYRRI